jgi:hypothetical protein
MVSSASASRRLWNQSSCVAWREALDEYPTVIERSGGARLVELDTWYHGESPDLVIRRSPRWITLDELIRVVEWKMHRGVYRARNLVLVRSNSAEEVETASCEAFEAAPHPTRPIARLAKLKGVGPATASAVLAAVRPDAYPFFDDVVAEAIPEFGRVDFTLKSYARYAERLMERTSLLAVACPEEHWTPHAVGKALWSVAGGKSAT